MSYSEFMLCNLLREINTSFNELEYDLMFGEAKRIYTEFTSSKFNDVKYGEYDCVHKYIIKNKLNEIKFG